MVGKESTQAVRGHDATAATFDLVVVGAGIAGLNALFAATYYVPSGARVLLIDQKTAAAELWNMAYDYVRPHQPPPMFTVGDLEWDWQNPHLARQTRRGARSSRQCAPRCRGRGRARDPFRSHGECLR